MRMKSSRVPVPVPVSVFAILLCIGVVFLSEHVRVVEGGEQQQCEAGGADGECIASVTVTEEGQGQGQGQGENVSDDCVDLNEQCQPWASNGECSRKVGYMNVNCRKSCRHCQSCENHNDSCEAWASAGECLENPKYMMVYCAKACVACATDKVLDDLVAEKLEEKKKKEDEEKSVFDTPYGVKQEGTDDTTLAKLKQMEDYMENQVFKEQKYQKVKDECRNRHQHCAFWAGIGECEKTANYMIVNCAPACQTCDLLDFDNRCPYDKDEPTALNPGDVDRLFENILTQFTQYEPVVLSRPNTTESEKDGPWVVTLEKFLTEEECDRFIELGAIEGYQQSKDVGKVKFDGSYDSSVNSGRTSTNAWCREKCHNDPVSQSVEGRISELTGIPTKNSEYLQLLRYEPGQHYQRHHDYIEHHRERRQGVRILTVFLYLNDVEAGGGTDFPVLGITVTPKKGKAVIWPSVKNTHPNIKDPRTDHQALPVEAGIKYGANAWIHQRDFKEPYERGCI